LTQTMTDRAIAGQFETLADDYRRRAERASHVDAAKALARSAASASEITRTVAMDSRGSGEHRPNTIPGTVCI